MKEAEQGATVPSVDLLEMTVDIEAINGERTAATAACQDARRERLQRKAKTKQKRENERRRRIRPRTTRRGHH